MQLGSLEIRSTKDLIGPETRICTLIYSAAKEGKTLLAGSLDAVTKKHRGKPTLIIACEASEGGGTMTLHTEDTNYVMPKTYQEVDQLLAALATDETFGGVVLDNMTDYVVRIVRPYALKFPTKEQNSPFAASRVHGVPTRSDYQVIAECARQQLNKLLNLTNENTDLRFRKDLIVTALEKEHTDDYGKLEAVKPALPGALADVATAMFQSVICLGKFAKVVPDGKSTRRVEGLKVITRDPVRITGDRTGMWVDGFELTTTDGHPIGLLPLYESWRSKMPASS